MNGGIFFMETSGIRFSFCVSYDVEYVSLKRETPHQKFYNPHPFSVVKCSAVLTKRGVFLTSVLLSASIASTPASYLNWTERAIFTWDEQTYLVDVASCASSVEQGRERVYEIALQEMSHYQYERNLIIIGRIELESRTYLVD
jgi:hypothetical protein